MLSLRPSHFKNRLVVNRPSGSPTTSRSLVITCAANDGKKRRPKKQSGSSSSDEDVSKPDKPPPPPPRVTNHSLIPVRQQIRIVKEVRQVAAAAQRPPAKPALYRKPTKTPEELKQERQLRDAEVELLSKTESKNISLRSLYDTSGSRHPPIVLVDGYNVLHKWDKTKGYFNNVGPDDLDIARNILLESLGTYSKFRSMRICVAFDAMGSGTDSEYITALGVTVRYCGSLEADSYIEGEVAKWLEFGATKVVVVTDDVAQKAVVDSRKTTQSQTCFVIPCSGLIKDMTQSQVECDQVLDNQAPTMSLLGSVVKAKDRNKFQKLQELRLGGIVRPAALDLHKGGLNRTKKGSPSSDNGS